MKKEPRYLAFMERFNELKGDMTQEEFAKKLGMSRATVGFYCAGIRIPDALGVAKIAKICGVTSDWLLGLEDEPIQGQKEWERMIVEAERENFYQLNWLDIFMVGHKGFIAGGCFKNIFNGQKVKHLDIFFENQRDYDEAILYYEEISGENGDQEFRFYYENENVKAYKHQSGITIELCQKVFGTPKEIISNFDFTICKFAY